MKREAVEKKGKEKQDGDEQAVKEEMEENEREQPAEKENEKEEKEEKDDIEETELLPGEFSRQDSCNGSKRILDPLVQRLEGIAESVTPTCGNSPHGTVDERVTVSQDISTSEKVCVYLFCLVTHGLFRLCE